MTTLVNAAGTTLTKAGLPKTSAPVVALWQITSDVYETRKLDGVQGFTGRSLKWVAGQIVTDIEFNNAFATATYASITPATGTAAGGTPVTIKGTNLRGATGATIGGVAVTAFVVVDEETITCTTGAHAAGANTLVIADDAGNVTATNVYTYV